MIYKATNLIKEVMDEKGIRCQIDEREGSSSIRAGFNIKNGPGADIRFISTDDDNDVAVRLFGMVNDVSEDKKGQILEIINECNKKYRYVKFVLDKDLDVNIEYDFPVRAGDATIGNEACEVFVRFMKIVDDCYPLFMKCIWS